MLNIHNFQFAARFARKLFRQKIWHFKDSIAPPYFFYSCPPPPPIRKMDRRPCHIKHYLGHASVAEGIDRYSIYVRAKQKENQYHFLYTLADVTVWCQEEE